MCSIHTLCKAGTVCIRMADPHLIFDRIGVCTIRTHMCRLLPEDLEITLKQVLSLCTINFIPPIPYGRTIDPAKQGVVIIKGFFIRVNNIPPPPL